MNDKAFTPEEVEAGLHLDLINYLLDYNTKSKECYNDIHITTDGFCIIVEWVERDYKESWVDPKFELVDEEHTVAYIGHMEDNTTQLFWDKEEYEEALENAQNEDK